MKVIVDVSEERIRDIKMLLEKNNFDFEISDEINSDEDFEIPQWQKDESEKRWKEFEKSPEIAIPWRESLARLEKKRV